MRTTSFPNCCGPSTDSSVLATPEGLDVSASVKVPSFGQTYFSNDLSTPLHRAILASVPKIALCRNRGIPTR